MLVNLLVGGALNGSIDIRAQDLPLTERLSRSTISPLDPSRQAGAPMLEGKLHTPLPEQYIWTVAPTAASARLIYTFPAITEQTEPHYFRDHFNMKRVPSEATLYIAGPRSIVVWINGQLAERTASDTSSPLGMHVFMAPVAKFLHAGANVIAIKAVRGRGVTGFANSALVRQQTFGQVMVVKIIPRAANVPGEDILHSDASWRRREQARSRPLDGRHRCQRARHRRGLRRHDPARRHAGPPARPRPQPVDQQVNGIPGYSSFWFTGVADFYRHSGDKAFLEREHQRMLELLAVVDSEFDQRGLYVNKSQA